MSNERTYRSFGLGVALIALLFVRDAIASFFVAVNVLEEANRWTL